MAGRVVYGNDHSSNGWPMVDEGSCTWVDVPGTNPVVRLQIQNGQPLQILRAFVADINAYVEHVRDADTGCWTAGNSVSTSNHLSGTAVDVDWELHPFRVADAGWSAGQINTIRQIQDFYEGTVFWGNDWEDPKDAMHFQLSSLANGGDIDTFNNPHTQDFINRKIRADGFSMLRRDGIPVPSVMTVPLVQTSSNRWTSPSPAWAHLINRESGGNPTIIQQIIDVNSGGNEAEGLFQITPRTWRAHSGDEFAPSPRSATPQQQAIVAARIFTHNPSGSDWGAGLPGREDASQLADGLVPLTEIPTQGDDDLSAEAERQIHVIYQEITKTFPSRSPLRHLGEGAVDTMAGFVLNTDGSVHVEIVKLLAGYGHPPTLALLREVAGADPRQYPDRQDDAKIAQAILADVTAPVVTVTQNITAPHLEPGVVYMQAPTGRTSNPNGSTGQLLGQLFDALEAVKTAQVDLGPQGKASIDSLISVLQPATGVVK